jgi:ABC-type phosphate/phosphonate transport system substrate-binding protein
MIANFRMYSPVPSAAQAWRALFGRVFVHAGLDLDIIEHAPPARLADLYKREDLGCAFMCGWPFVRHGKMQPVAAPVPSPARYDHQPRYCSEFLVREESGWASLEDTFGHRLGWMAADSQSGFNAPRAHLARYVTPERPNLYAELRGPLGAPMSTLEALRRGDIDVTALDCFWLDILRRHDPARLQGIRCVAATEWTPLPLLVASPDADEAVVERLREFLPHIHEQPGYAPFLADLVVERFVTPAVGNYSKLQDMAEAGSRWNFSAPSAE